MYSQQNEVYFTIIAIIILSKIKYAADSICPLAVALLLTWFTSSFILDQRRNQRRDASRFLKKNTDRMIFEIYDSYVAQSSNEIK